jgi:hypothetical protein
MNNGDRQQRNRFNAKGSPIMFGDTEITPCRSYDEFPNADSEARS